MVDEPVGPPSAHSNPSPGDGMGCRSDSVEREDRMQPARLVFRCRRCGEKEDGPEGVLRTVETVLIQLLSSGSKGVNVTGAGQVTPCSMHVCKDGGRGVTDIEGIEMVCEKKPAALKSAGGEAEDSNGEQ